MVQLENIFQKLREDGYVILEDFFSLGEVEEMRNAGLKLAKDIHSDSNEKVVFDGIKNSFAKNSYFEESADNISPFYDQKTVDKQGQIMVDPKKSLARIGHALHSQHPIFKKFVFDERVKNVCKELEFKDPAVAISMYLYKNSNLSTGVDPHQESTFLYNDPTKLVSFWVALDDVSGLLNLTGATICVSLSATMKAADGCLEVVPKSHLDCLHRRYVRNDNLKSDERFVFDEPMPEFTEDQFIPLAVRKGIDFRKGAVILMDGKLIHKSAANVKDGDRHSFIFNVIEQKDSVYDEKNWCQPKNGFMKLYGN